MKHTFIQQITANFVAVELRKGHFGTVQLRLDRLKALMAGAETVRTTDEETGISAVSSYHLEFEGVEPLTELLDPAWDGPVAPVTATLVNRVIEVDEAA